MTLKKEISVFNRNITLKINIWLLITQKSRGGVAQCDVWSPDRILKQTQNLCFCSSSQTIILALKSLNDFNEVKSLNKHIACGGKTSYVML